MNLKKIPDTLPDLPSDLILLALKDLKTVSRKEGYGINMGCWHEGEEYNGVCYVCLAGSVMANSCNIPSNVSARCYHFNNSLYTKFRALNVFREGDVREGVRLCLKVLKRKFPIDLIVYYYVVPEYEHDQAGFFKAMKKMAQQLKELGL